MKVRVDELKQLTTKALLHYGYTQQESDQIGEVLLYAQLRGNNQGVVKLIGAGIPKTATAPIETVKETKVSALLDAHQNQAMLAVNQAADVATAKAKEHGIAVVGVHGINTSSGAIGYYVRKMAEQGLVGMLFVSAPPVVAAHGSYQAILGTNPLAIGVPSQGGPLVLDMATAAMAYFGVIEANTAGKQLPQDIAYDKEGSLTTDPAKVLDGGAMRTFDKNYKGAHLSLMVQLLAGPMVGAAFMDEGDMDNNWAGTLIVAIDPDILGGTEHLRQSVTKIAQKVKDTKKLPGTTEITLPSERGDRLSAQALKTGEVEIEDNLLSELKKVANR